MEDQADERRGVDRVGGSYFSVREFFCQKIVFTIKRKVKYQRQAARMVGER